MAHDLFGVLTDATLAVAGWLGLKFFRRIDILERKVAEQHEELQEFARAIDDLETQRRKTNRIVNRIYVGQHPKSFPPLSDD